MQNPDNSLNAKDTIIISNKHLRLLDDIFRKQHLSPNLSELQSQILGWAQIVLSDERTEWVRLRADSVDILHRLRKREEARKRAAAKNKRYEPFKAAFKLLQEKQFRKYQNAGKMLSANAFVKWFLQNTPSTMTIPYIESNRTNQLIKLAQINNREFKKLLNAKADTSPTVED